VRVQAEALAQGDDPVEAARAHPQISSGVGEIAATAIEKVVDLVVTLTALLLTSLAWPTALRIGPAGRVLRQRRGRGVGGAGSVEPGQ
jgi:hypothetical protein